jgi:hypothetical protein
MKYAHYAVAYQRTPDDFLYLTMFALIDRISCSLPSGKEGFLDTEHYKFKHLTSAEYDTYIAFNAMEVRDSDYFAVFMEDFEIPDGS